MAYKIHKRGAFVIIENTVNGEIKELNSQYVQITKGKTSLDQYEVLYNGVSQLKAVLGDILDSNGVTYVEADWDTFRYEQCGSVNSSEVANPYPAPTVATVDITSAQILAMGTTPIELLPAPGVNKYYDIEKIILEYTHVSTAYTSTETTLIYSGCSVTPVHIDFLTQISNAVVESSNGGVLTSVDSTSLSYPYALNQSLTLGTFNASDPTLGNGTLRAIITYTTRTFGA